MKNLNSVVLFGIFMLILGAPIAGQVLGFRDDFLMVYGIILMLLGLSIMVTYGGWMMCGQNIITGTIVSACFMTVIFCCFAFLGAIPFIDPESRLAYGLIAVPFLAIGGSTTSIQRITIKRKNKNGKVETREYVVKTKSTAFGDETTIERKK